MSDPRAVTRGESRVALSLSCGVDWLSFTLPPTAGTSHRWVREFLSRFFNAEGWEERRGWQGYECSARVDGCIVAWGGENQRGSTHVEIPGSVCSGCNDWAAVAGWLERAGARITRCDLYADDFFGVACSVDWAIAQWREGGFTGQGRKPGARLIDDFGSGDGRTLYVGRRENGKLARVYEKGRELGDASSPWCRFEVEFRAKDRVLPFSMLASPSAYLAGSFPCASMFAEAASVIRTVKERARISYQRAIEIARLHAGRVVNAILLVTGGDVGAVVSSLARSGLPKRLERDFIALESAGADT